MPRLKFALLTMVPLLCATAAVAQPSPADNNTPPAMQGHHMDHAARHKEMCTDMYAHRASRLAYVQAKLNLTEQQQAAWNKWRQAVLDEATKAKTACLEITPKADNAPPTILDREAGMEKMLSMKLQALQTTRPALEALYNVLSPDQKTTLDRSFGHHGHHGKGRHMGPHRGWGMHQPG